MLIPIPSRFQMRCWMLSSILLNGGTKSKLGSIRGISTSSVISTDEPWADTRTSRYDWLSLPHDIQTNPNESVAEHPHRQAWQEAGQKFRNRWHEMVNEENKPRGGYDSNRPRGISPYYSVDSN